MAFRLIIVYTILPPYHKHIEISKDDTNKEDPSYHSYHTIRVRAVLAPPSQHQTTTTTPSSSFIPSPSNNNMSFSFDFALSDQPNSEAHDHDDDINKEKAAEEAPTDNDELWSQPRSHLQAFVWMDRLSQLLESRRHEQIIYEDIRLFDCSNEDESDDTDAADDDDDDDDDNAAASNPPTVLRRVDMTRSSFAMASQHQHDSCNDLVPGVYEGGLKVWESSLDLLQYMVSHPESWRWKDDSTSTRYLELGCGHGLPLCYILQQAVRNKFLSQVEVTALDYNDYVLKDCTLSNIVLNLADLDVASDDLAPRIHMASGDWMGILRPSDGTCTIASTDHNQNTFDWIAATETLYSVEAARETALLIAKLLRPESGQAWVASKRYYFGVGGGVDAFREAALAPVFVPASDASYRLQIESVRVYDNGKANIRELLRVCLKKD